MKGQNLSTVPNPIETRDTFNLILRNKIPKVKPNLQYCRSRTVFKTKVLGLVKHVSLQASRLGSLKP